MTSMSIAAGIKPTDWVLEIAETSFENEPAFVIPNDLKSVSHNAYIVDLFLNRSAKPKVKTSSFISMRDMARYNKNLIKVDIDRTANMDFDWKGELVDPRMVFVGQVVGNGNPEHITLSTRPWKNVEQFREVRDLFDQWRHKKDGV